MQQTDTDATFAELLAPETRVKTLSAGERERITMSQSSWKLFDFFVANKLHDESAMLQIAHEDCLNTGEPFADCLQLLLVAANRHWLQENNRRIDNLRERLGKARNAFATGFSAATRTDDKFTVRTTA